MFLVASTYMNQHHISLNEALELLMDTDIDNLDRKNNHPLLKELFRYCKDMGEKYLDYDSNVREAYAHLRLKFHRLLKPKTDPGNGLNGTLHSITETIRHLLNQNSND